MRLSDSKWSFSSQNEWKKNEWSCRFKEGFVNLSSYRILPLFCCGLIFINIERISPCIVKNYETQYSNHSISICL